MRSLSHGEQMALQPLVGSKPNRGPGFTRPTRLLNSDPNGGGPSGNHDIDDTAADDDDADAEPGAGLLGPLKGNESGCGGRGKIA
jgi:hypothetical protein